MRKLSDYVEQAATEYLRETGRVELDARWSAAFYQEQGVLDDFPLLDLVAFHALVQKALTVKAERAGKQARRHIERVMDSARRRRRR
jgi:hypothetical protein